MATATSPAYRHFEGVDLSSARAEADETAASPGDLAASRAADALSRVRDDVVGHGARVHTPFGAKRLLYADWAASGRALHTFEEVVRREVLPLYANTHSTTSAVGLQASAFRREAREHVARAFNARTGAGSAHADVVLWTGTGSTGAIDRLVRILGLHLPPRAGTPRAVVFVGPLEHHSNLLPWREAAGAEVEPLPEDARTGTLDRAALGAALARHAAREPRPLLIGSFSAASNVTGVAEHVDAVSAQLHRAGALVFWDYAACAAHGALDMNPIVLDADGAASPWVYKDAAFVSSHKLPGGVGAPGVLVVKRRLLTNAVPAVVGGGTVFFVTATDHRYLANAEEREEGGTPDLVGSVRCGLACQLLVRLGRQALARAHAELGSALWRRLRGAPGLLLLGAAADGAAPARAAVVSFVVRAPAHAPGAPSRLLHHHAACAMLSDLFGVQARAGCACAGPYAHRLLGISAADSARLEAALVGGAELLRPGFVRVALPPFASAAELEYLAAAVRLVAAHGWRLLPQYRLDPRTGEARHRTRARSFPARRWLASCAFPLEPAAGREAAGLAPEDDARALGPDALGACWAEQLAAAESELTALGARGGRALGAAAAAGVARSHDAEDELTPALAGRGGVGAHADAHAGPAAALRWFATPAEMLALLAETCAARAATGASAAPSGAALAGAAERGLPLSVVPAAGPLHGPIDPARYSAWRAAAAAAAAGAAGGAASAPAAAAVSRAAASATPPRAAGAAAEAAAPNGPDADGAAAEAAARTEAPHPAARASQDEACAQQDPSARVPFGSAAAASAHAASACALLAELGGAHRAQRAAAAPAEATHAPAIGASAASGCSASTPSAPRQRAQPAARACLSDSDCDLPSDGEGATDVAAGTWAARAAARTAGARPHAAAQPDGVAEAGTCKQPPAAPHARAAEQANGVCAVPRVSSQKHPLRTAGGGAGGAGGAGGGAGGAGGAGGGAGGAGGGSGCEEEEGSALLAQTASCPLRPPAPAGVPRAPGGGGWHAPPRSLMRCVWRALTEWRMIRPGETVLVGLSGGKDSLCLLHALREVQRRSPPGFFALGAVTVDPGTSAFDPSPLRAYTAALGIDLEYVPTPIFDSARSSMQGDSICAFCARLKRGALYDACRRRGARVLALGQHLDDLAESFLLSALRNGKLRTMKGCYEVDAGDVRVVRPLMHVRERETRAFSFKAGLPVIADNCPACFEAPKERREVKRLLAAQEAVFPDTLSCLGRALAPLSEPAVADVLALVGARARGGADERSGAGARAAHEARAALFGGGTGGGADGVIGHAALAAAAQTPSAEQQAALDELSDATLLAELARRQRSARAARALRRPALLRADAAARCAVGGATAATALTAVVAGSSTADADLRAGGGGVLVDDDAAVAAGDYDDDDDDDDFD